MCCAIFPMSGATPSKLNGEPLQACRCWYRMSKTLKRPPSRRPRLSYDLLIGYTLDGVRPHGFDRLVTGRLCALIRRGFPPGLELVHVPMLIAIRFGGVPSIP